MTSAPDLPELASPAEVYAGRLAARRDEMERLTRRHGWLSAWHRLLLGVVVIVVILAEKERTPAKLALVGCPALLLAGLIVRRARLARLIGKCRWFAGLYEQRLACVEDRWPGTGKSGLRYLEADHPAAADLDLFGVGSLFERLAVPSTRIGEDTLASWLLTPGDAAEVLERQGAVAELRDRLELREGIAYLAGQIQASAALAQLADWGQAVPVPPSWTTRALCVSTLALSLAALLGGSFFQVGKAPVLIALGLQIGVAIAFHRRASATLSPLENHAFDLASLSRLLARVQSEPFTSTRLVRLRGELTGGSAARQTAWLHRFRCWAPLTLILACRPQAALLVDRWRQISGPAFGRWLAALGEIEALSALGTYAYECPHDSFPEVLDTGTIFEAEAVGHPLLPRARCVRNDLALGGENLRLLLISGSNMAGKSTLLRAAGVNSVLALAGAPVRARRLRLAPLVVGATLRIQDSLLAGRSRFHAEVLRVRRLLEMTQGKLPLFFLLDELFQGTNSADRRIGAEAVLRQLLDAGAIGLVTTHDLALTEIANKFSGQAANTHFEDQFDQGELTFDYQMKPGVVRHTNGLALMRAVGIKV
jgi:MutS domain V